MTTRKPARSMLTSVVVTLLVAGCSATTSSSNVAPSGTDAGAQSPIDGYLASSIQTWRQARVNGANAREDALAACMAKSGFTYVPQYSAPAPTPTAPDRDDEGWIAEHGYGLSGTDGAPVAPGALSQENAAYVEGLSSKERDAYLLTQFGDDPEGGARIVGCATADEDADPERSVATKKLTADRAKLAKEAAADPVWVEADGKWAACMAGAGHGGLTRQTDAQASMEEAYAPLHENFGDGTLPEDQLAPILKEERALALVDFHCVRDTGFAAATSSVTRRLEEAYVGTHRAQLDAVVTAYRSAS